MTMQKTTTASGEIRPRIILTASDHERLSLLARAAAAKMPDLVSVLTDELERAEILPHGYPERTVRMGSEVEFRDDATGKGQTHHPDTSRGWMDIVERSDEQRDEERTDDGRSTGFGRSGGDQGRRDDSEPAGERHRFAMDLQNARRGSVDDAERDAHAPHERHQRGATSDRDEGSHRFTTT